MAERIKFRVCEHAYPQVLPQPRVQAQAARLSLRVLDRPAETGDQRWRYPSLNILLTHNIHASGAQSEMSVRRRLPRRIIDRGIVPSAIVNMGYSHGSLR